MPTLLIIITETEVHHGPVEQQTNLVKLIDNQLIINQPLHQLFMNKKEHLREIEKNGFKIKMNNELNENQSKNCKTY